MEAKERIREALHQAKHYTEMAEDALEGGNLDDAEGWLLALSEEVEKAVLGEG